MNECLEWGYCDQVCYNTEGSYKCVCVAGYDMDSSPPSPTCRVNKQASKMRLYFTYHDKILKVRG